MIIGIGTDVVYIPRIEKLYKRFGNKLFTKILTKQEIELLNYKSSKQICCHIAKRFAAKEALVKSLGTGFSNNITLTDISILNDSLGKPHYLLNQKLINYILSITDNKKFVTHLSLSDEYPIAAAFAMIEKL
jgi:holo-[acyl-carrier protein] synthase